MLEENKLFEQEIESQVIDYVEYLKDIYIDNNQMEDIYTLDEVYKGEL